MGSINGSLINGISNGLTNTYAVIANASGANGVTLSSISSTRTNSEYAASLNQTFASYLENNFKALDKNKDGILSADELTGTTSMFNAGGLTYNQLIQLGSSTGLPQETLNQVLAHFNDIDTNKDGKVTSAEINAYNATSSKMKLQDEFREKFISGMSVFYGDESSSDSASSSVLSYKYLD